MKIEKDKYYTPLEVAKYIVKKTKEVCVDIEQYIEPSAGGGVFLDLLDKPYKAYDILPDDKRIIKQDFLQLEEVYTPKLCVIGNPPFGGQRLNLAKQFFIKSTSYGDYISFILPITVLNSTMDSFYHFDLLHQEDLGVLEYSSKKVRTAFFIFKRPLNGLINKRVKLKFKDLEILECRRSNDKKRQTQLYEGIGDFRMCCWGYAGREVQFPGQYVDEQIIVIHNNYLKDKIIKVLKEADWLKEYPPINPPSVHLSIQKTLRYLKKMIPELT